MVRGAGIPRGWWLAFCIELPIVLATLVFWTVQPDTFLHDSIGIEDPAAPHRYLLRLYSGTVGSLVLWFYGRVLLSARVHLPTFRLLQEALLIGDVVIVALGVAVWGRLDVASVLLAAQIGMASFWGLVRVAFLLQVPASRPGPDGGGTRGA